MFRRRPGKPDADDASAYSRRAAAADYLWVAQDRARSGLRGGFERISFGLQERVVWPLQDRAAAMDAPGRALSRGAAVVLAAAAVAAGLLVAGSGDSPDATDTRVAVNASAPAEAKPPQPQRSGPTLQGAAPVFEPAETPSRSEVDPAKAIVKSAPAEDPAAGAGAQTSSAAASSSAAESSEVDGPPASPAAISVARDFAGAFVLYETGETDSEVRQAFADTATPALARALLERPPR